MSEPIRFGECCKNFWGFHWRGVVSMLIPIICLPICLLNEGKEFLCLYLVAVVAFYWITEVIPLYVASLIPAVALPLLGILDSIEVCRNYFGNVLVLFICGLIIALAIEYSNLHKRIALKTILIVGYSPRRLHFGLLMVAAFISMWISNSAATAMMCPIVKAVLEELHSNKIINIYEEKKPNDPDQDDHPSMLANAYYLGVAYACSIGGCGTLIGTGTNLTFKGIYEKRFPKSPDTLDFPIFMAYCVPFVIIAVLALFLSLQIFCMGLWRPKSKAGQEVAAGLAGADVVEKVIKARYEELGSMSCHEIQVALLFLLMIVLLFTLSPGFMPGWGDFFNAVKIKGSWPMVFVAVLLLVLPINYNCCKHCTKTGPFPKTETLSLISYDFVYKHTPWGLFLLLGGGFALSHGSTASGMAKMLGEALSFFKNFPPAIAQLGCLLSGVFFTNFSANVAIANILIPVFCEMAVVIKVHPLYLVYPAGLGCSLAYHLPVSTPPNAIAAGYANIKTKHIAYMGIYPSVTGILVLFFICQTWHFVFYPSIEAPEWAV